MKWFQFGTEYRYHKQCLRLSALAGKLTLMLERVDLTKYYLFTRSAETDADRVEDRRDSGRQRPRTPSFSESWLKAKMLR